MAKTANKILTAFIFLFLILAVTIIIFRGLFPVKYESTVEKYCRQYSVDTSLVYALIKAESNYKENASSHAGAKGLMQLTEQTFEYCRGELKMASDNIFDPQANIQAGIWYLSYLLDKYDGDTKNAVAAYNAGETNVDRWLEDSKYSKDSKTLRDIPFGETKRHVGKIQRYVKIYEYIYF